MMSSMMVIIEAITWADVDPSLCGHMSSLRHNGLTSFYCVVEHLRIPMQFSLNFLMYIVNIQHIALFQAVTLSI